MIIIKKSILKQVFGVHIILPLTKAEVNVLVYFYIKLELNLGRIFDTKGKDIASSAFFTVDQYSNLIITSADKRLYLNIQ